MKYVSVIALGIVLCACSKTPDYALPQNPTGIERKLLVVPHRDWIESGCYPKLVDGRDVKVCNANTNSK
jgi:hypothetical protein